VLSTRWCGTRHTTTARSTRVAKHDS
jgi:hypothetical protein